MNDPKLPKFLNHNKSPYEIRTQLLEIAQKYLQTQYELNMEIYRAIFSQMMKHNYASMNEFEKIAPKMYNFSDIVEKAKELSEFVNTKVSV